MDELLRREVRLLTTRLGAMVQEQCGSAVFDAIENLRKLAKESRQDALPGVIQRIEDHVQQLTLAQASEVAHAFSLFFHLVNLAEERQRVRRLHAYEPHEAGAPMSLRHTFSELRRHRVAPSAVARLLNSMRIEPVLTAHPTEAKRRSVLNHLRRISRALEQLDSDSRDHGAVSVSQALDAWVEALWLTSEVRERPVTPETELESTLVYLEGTIYDLAGSFWQAFLEELARYQPGMKAPAPFLRFGSWVGTDRDGNPNVTPETSLRVAAELRASVLRYYRRVCERLLGVVSFPCRKPSLERAMRRDLERDMQRFPATRDFEALDQPHEVYRRKLRVMIWRLERTLDGADGGYAGAPEFTQDVALLDRLLRQHPSPRVAHLGPGRLRAAAEILGFHGASLDFRQHSAVTRAAASEILARAGLPNAPLDARVASIQELLTRSLRVDAEALSETTRRTLAEFRALREIQVRNGEEAAHRYVLSMAASAADVWDVSLLGQQTGLVSFGERGSGGPARVWSSLDVVPLFETFDDLKACPQQLDRLLSDPLYRQVLGSRGGFQEVMLGYSDSVKDSGYVAANWSLFCAQKSLGQVAERHGVRLGLFHGIGGTIDRGGGQSYRSVRAQPYAAPGGRLRITEQGEVISLKYSNPAIAQRNLEQLATSVIDSTLLVPRRVPQERLAEWEAYAEELATASRAFYRELVYETPDFPQYFQQATPIDLISQLRLGSRPSRRAAGDDFNDLRAIPWVFAWTQSRHFLPSWYGLGFALDKFVQDHAPDGLERLREMYAHWLFFSVLIDNAEASLAKTDLYIAGEYASLVRPKSLGERIFGRVKEEYERACRLVLEICGRTHLLAHQPVLAESIRLRNPYVDPLNFIQIKCLERWRQSRRPDPQLMHLLQTTVAGVAFGMKSTG
ncbi:MAG TPA: phosphoenolpyruvate carboxylase [Terriglobia bacterium]|nr:phosphoenolpyruvate carboxylase [Terriglobia bacterium]